MREKAEIKRRKLCDLQKFMDLETGDVNKSSFKWERELYRKACEMKPVAEAIWECEKCEAFGKDLNNPTPGWGNLNADVMIVGQSLHQYGVDSELTFILGSGLLLDAACRLSYIRRNELFITNTVSCHPERNRTSTMEEKRNCLGHLEREIDVVEPKLIVAMGNDAKWAISKIGATWMKPHWEFPKVWCCKHPASYMHKSAGCEAAVGWVVKLSDEMDKVLTKG